MTRGDSWATLGASPPLSNCESRKSSPGFICPGFKQYG